MRELVDLHGAAGFDVLCITDHAYRLEDPATDGVDGWSWPGYSPSDWTPLRPTRRLCRELDLFRDIVDRQELLNRREIFAWVAHENPRPVATGDFHRREHLASWKTLLPCPECEEAVVEYLRSAAPASVTPLWPDLELPELAAA